MSGWGPMNGASSAVVGTLKHGLNAVQSNVDTPLELQIKGVTLANLLGTDGNFISGVPKRVSGYTAFQSTISVPDASAAYYGTGGMKVTYDGTGTPTGFGVLQGFLPDPSKYYLVGVMGKCDAGASYCNLSYNVFQFGGTLNANSQNAVPSDGWKFIYSKVSPSHFGAATNGKIELKVIATAAGQSAYFDGVRFYEIDQATYNKIDVDPEYTGEKLGEKFPYVDGVKPLTNPLVINQGKNLLPPFTEWTHHAETTVVSPYSISIAGTGNDRQSSIYLPVIVGQVYSFSCDVTTNAGAAYWQILGYDKNGVQITSEVATGVVTNFTFRPTDARVVTIRVATRNAGAGTFTFSNPMLVVGDLSSLPPSFVPNNPDYCYIPTTLAASLDGAVADSLTFRDGAWRKTKKFAEMTLDGSRSWGFTDYTGFKQAYLNTDIGITLNNPVAYLQKSDGRPLERMIYSVVVADVPDMFSLDSRLSTGTGKLYVRVADAESGWGETYSPVSAEIQAYFNGWKMNNGTFGTPYNGTGTKTWVAFDAANNTGSVTVVPTTVAPNYTPYKLTYQLTTTVEEIIPAEGSIELNTGYNQLELGEGVIVREKTAPKQGTGANVLANYYININGSATSGSTLIPSGGELKNRSAKILQVYKYGVPDKKWAVLSSASAYGLDRASISVADYDSTAEYTVSYIALDKYLLTANANTADITYQANEHMAQRIALQKIADLETNMSVLVNAMAEVYKRMKAGGI